MHLNRENFQIFADFSKQWRTTISEQNLVLLIGPEAPHQTCFLEYKSSSYITMIYHDEHCNIFVLSLLSGKVPQYRSFYSKLSSAAK